MLINKCLLLSLACLMLAACQPPQQYKKAKQSAHKTTPPSKAISEEDKAVNLITDLEEVKLKSAEVEKNSKGNRHLETMWKPTNG